MVVETTAIFDSKVGRQNGELQLADSHSLYRVMGRVLQVMKPDALEVAAELTFEAQDVCGFDD